VELADTNVQATRYGEALTLPPNTSNHPTLRLHNIPKLKINNMYQPNSSVTVWGDNVDYCSIFPGKIDS